MPKFDEAVIAPPWLAESLLRWRKRLADADVYVCANGYDHVTVTAAGAGCSECTGCDDRQATAPRTTRPRLIASWRQEKDT